MSKLLDFLSASLEPCDHDTTEDGVCIDCGAIIPCIEPACLE